MSIEGPILTAIIARLADAKFNLAAYGVAFSIALFVEGPIIMILSAATALARDRESYVKLRNFTYALNGLVTLLIAVLAIPGVFYPFAEGVLGLSPRVAGLSYVGTLILLPWPAAIGFRRFWQGILIRYGRTRLVTWGTVVRLVSMVAGALLCWLLFEADGIVVGAVGLSLGVTAEAVAAWFMARASIRELRRKERTHHTALTYSAIVRFYIPLALTSIIGLAAQPFLTMFLGQGRSPEESLAVWPVVGGFVFLFRGVGLAWQEVVIALIGDRFEHYQELRRFTIVLSAVVSGALAIVAFTPLASIWYEGVVDLSPALAHFALLPTQIMVLLPATSVVISLQRGVLVAADRTGPVSAATAVEVVVMLAVILVLIYVAGVVGVVAAAAAVVIGRLCANAYIAVPYVKALKKR